MLEERFIKLAHMEDGSSVEGGNGLILIYLSNILRLKQ
jgi:hypothetical protein